HSQENQLHVHAEPGLGDGPEIEPPALSHHLDLFAVELAHPAPGIAGEALGRDRVEALAALLVRRGDAKDVGPFRPGIARAPGVGRTGEQLELVYRPRALAMDGAQAVRARVAAADDHHALARGADECLVGDSVALAATVLLSQVLHGEVDALELAAGHGQIAWVTRAAGEHDGVEVAPEVGHGLGHPD